MFIGEGPGAKEQEAGVPFVGPVGKVLDSVLLHLGLSRARVYVSNIVKCRAQENEKDRTPTAQEAQECVGWLKKEIEILKPKIIVPLGQTALNHLTQSTSIGGISSLAGKRYDSVSGGLAGEALVVPLVHPAACLYGFKKEVYLSQVEALRKILEEEKIV
jgi:DNA polymerase